MQPKELANVLVKLLGLSLCLYSIPELVYGLIMAMMAGDQMRHVPLWTSVLGPSLRLALGIFVIAKNRALVGALFTEEPS
jgi:hypothetical protein